MSILASHLKPWSLRVIHGAVTTFPHGWDQLHDSIWLLWWAAEPGIWIDHARGRLEVPPRQAVLLPAGCSVRVGARGRPRLLWLKIDLPLLAEPLAALGPLVPQVLPGDDVLTGLAQRADDGRGLTPPGWAEAFAWAVLAAWWDHLPPAQAEALHRSQDALVPLQPVLRAVDDHLADPLPIPALAAASGLSPATIGRLFRRHLQTSPTAWIRHRRCMRAAELLTTTALPMEEIARRCGFAHRFLLTRHFTVFSGGISPARYRRQVCAKDTLAAE